jgi:hypothetical protein
MPQLRFTQTSEEDLQNLIDDPGKEKILKAVQRTLGLMETNLRHPSLNSHEFESLKGPKGEKVFEVYAQQKTPGAYRILWYPAFAKASADRLRPRKKYYFNYCHNPTSIKSKKSFNFLFQLIFNHGKLIYNQFVSQLVTLFIR